MTAPLSTKPCGIQIHFHIPRNVTKQAHWQSNSKSQRITALPLPIQPKLILLVLPPPRTNMSACLPLKRARVALQVETIHACSGPLATRRPVEPLRWAGSSAMESYPSARLLSARTHLGPVHAGSRYRCGLHADDAVSLPCNMGNIQSFQEKAKRRKDSPRNWHTRMPHPTVSRLTNQQTRPCHLLEHCYCAFKSLQRAPYPAGHGI